jgi:MFS transporter, UMF1 family
MEKVIPQKKIINAWATYDLANSVYNLVITATIFPIYYNLVTSEKDADGNIIKNTIDFFGFTLKNTALYDFALAFSFLLVAAIIPLLSGIADYSGNKKSFMKFFCYMGAIACAALYFFDKTNVGFGISMAIFACIGYSGSLVFYNAYLPEIAPNEMQDKVSAKGFAMGYWGSSILLIVSLALIMTRETGAEKMLMMKYAFVLVGLWWFGFAQIPFFFLPNGKTQTEKESKSKNSIFNGYSEIRKVFFDLKNDRKLITFLPAFFAYSMGVQTVMLVANHFGSDEIKMESGQLITTILIIQFVAMAGAYLFSFLSRKFGNIPTLILATIIWILICICTYFFVFTPAHFYVVAGFVGLVMGGIQSLSRSTYSKLLPQTKDHTSYFSFYDVCEKLSIVFGMLTFGVITQISSTMRTPILALIVFFVIGLIMLFMVPKSSK